MELSSGGSGRTGRNAVLEPRPLLPPGQQRSHALLQGEAAALDIPTPCHFLNVVIWKRNRHISADSRLQGFCCCCQLPFEPQIGTSFTSWRGYFMRSSDEGKTWGSEEALPFPVVGPSKNKPLELEDGTIIVGTSDEDGQYHASLAETP